VEYKYKGTTSKLVFTIEVIVIIRSTMDSTAESSAKTICPSESITPCPEQNTDSERIEIIQALEIETEGDNVVPQRKPIDFYLALLGLNITTFIYSLDATTLAVAIPVSFTSPRRHHATY
jgi:hypothetical protein